MNNLTDKLFISHSSHDKSFVDRLVADLQNNDIPVWYDKLDLRVGDSVTGGINEGLSDSKYFLIVLSRSSVVSRWVTEELNAALMEQVARGGTFVLPALLEDCAVPPLLGHRRYADFRNDYGTGLANLLAVFCQDEKAKSIACRKSLYPWPDIEKIQNEFVYLHSSRFDKLFRMDCDLSNNASYTIDYIVDTLNLPWTSNVPELGMRWSFRYSLIFNDESIDLSTSLRDAGVSEGAVLKLGINGTYSDLWTNELKNMWDGTRMYEIAGAMSRESKLKRNIQDRGSLTADRLRKLANACFEHV